MNCLAWNHLDMIIVTYGYMQHVRNVDWHHTPYLKLTSYGDSPHPKKKKKKNEKCTGQIPYCLIVQHYQSYQKRLKVCSATLMS